MTSVVFNPASSRAAEVFKMLASSSSANQIGKAVVGLHPNLGRREAEVGHRAEQMGGPAKTPLPFLR